MKFHKTILIALVILGFSTQLQAKEIDVVKLKEELKREIISELLSQGWRPTAPEKSQKNKEKQNIENIASYQGTSDNSKDNKKPKMVSFSGEVRIRPEFRRNLTQTVPAIPGNREEDMSVLLRSRLGVQFDPNKNLSFFIQGQDSRDFGEEAPGVPSGLGDDEGFDLHQAYIDIKNIGNKPLHIRAGRQEVALGEERLVGAVGWSNVGRSLDAIRINYNPKNFDITALAAITDKTLTGDSQYFGGVYTSWKKFPGGVLDGYYFLLQDNDGATGAAAGNGDTLSVHTIGTRMRSFFKNGLDYGIESAVQLGKFGSQSILAFAEHGELGYTISGSLKSRISTEYNFATGDSLGSSRYTKFNNLFPTNHAKYGYMDLVGWSNMHDGAAGISINPKKFFASLHYHLLLVDKNESTTDTFASYPGGGNFGKVAGHEIDFLAKWNPNDYLGFLSGYSHFIPGSYLKSQGINASADLFYVQAEARFK